jgi:hypothetical protein
VLWLQANIEDLKERAAEVLSLSMDKIGTLRRGFCTCALSLRIQHAPRANCSIEFRRLATLVET